MSTTTVLDIQQNLLEELLQLLPEHNDLSAYTIVFPGKRPSYFLQRLLFKRSGTACIPPNIYTFESFIRNIVALNQNNNPQEITDLDAAAILYSIHRDFDYLLGEGIYKSFAQFLPLAIKLFHEFEEVVLADISAKSFDQLISSYPYGRMQAVGKYFSAFYDHLNRKKLQSRALLYQQAVQHIEQSPSCIPTPLILAGFFTLTNIEKRLFEVIQQLENVTFLYQRVPDITEIDVDKFHFVKAPDVHGQMFALAQHLQTTSQPRDESMVIVLPESQSLYPLLHHVVPVLQSEQYNIALGYPLTRTPLAGFLREVFNVIISMYNNKIHAPTYIRFLLHPYVKNIRFKNRTDVTRILAHSLEKTFAEDKKWSFFSLEELESNTAFYESVASFFSAEEPPISSEQLRDHMVTIHNATLRKMLVIQQMVPLGVLADTLHSVLEYIYAHSTARLHPFFNNYVELLIGELHQLQQSLASEFNFDTAEEYALWFDQFMKSLTIPFSGTPLQGVQILGLLETRSLHFKTVFLPDANEGIIPPQADPPIIPREVRQKLGLETQQDRDKLIENYLLQLFFNAEEVYIYFTESTSGKQIRSRLVHKLLWQAEQKANRECEHELVMPVNYKLHLGTTHPTAINKTPSMLRAIQSLTFSPTMIDAYLHCPLRFYYSYLLHLREEEEVTDDLESKHIGTIVHQVLYKIFHPFISSVIKEDDLLKLPINQIVEEEISKALGQTLTGRMSLVKHQIQKQIERYIQHYRTSILSTSTVEIVHCEFPVNVHIEDKAFYGKIDRIEKRNEQLYILDYKTSSSDDRLKIRFQKININDRSTWSQAIGSLQLPLYAMMYARHTSIPPESIHCAYIMLGQAQFNTSAEHHLYKDGDTKEEYINLSYQILREILKELFSPDIPFLPSTNYEKHCISCPFTTICGTQWVKAKTRSS